MLSCQAKRRLQPLLSPASGSLPVFTVVNPSPQTPEPHLGKGITAKKSFNAERLSALGVQLPSAGEEEVLGGSGVRVAGSPDYVEEMGKAQTDKGYAEARL